MNSLISIIIPVYNRVHLLPKVLNSIKNQTYKNIEVIVVDDGSDPAVQSSEFRVQSNDLSIKLIRQENKGAPSARNQGLEESKGEYVIFWDADIVAEKQMLEKMHQALQENDNVSYAFCNHQIYITKYITKKILVREFNLEELKKNNYIHSTSLIRKKATINWDESLSRFQDWDLWLTMAEQGKKGIWVDEYLFTVLGGGTISGWLPSFVYKAPFKWLPGIVKQVEKYEKTREVVIKKHGLDK